MKYMLFILCLLPLVTVAQDRADAEMVMKRFMRFYNAHQNDSIYNMFSARNRRHMTPERNIVSMQYYTDSAGALKSFEYLGIDEDDKPYLFVFKTRWSLMGVKTSGFTLNKNNKFETFRLLTRSEGIDRMLRRQR